MRKRSEATTSLADQLIASAKAPLPPDVVARLESEQTVATSADIAMAVAHADRAVAPPPPRAAFAPVPSFAEIADGLAKCLGIHVTLPTVAQWTLEQRADAKRALESGGKTVPEWLDSLRVCNGTISDPPAPRAPRPTSPVPMFASANRGPGISTDMARIVEHVYAVDAWRDYEDLERNLEIGDGRGDYATVARHVDGCETKARRAHALYLASKLELLRFEAASEKVTAGMRQQALDVLEDEKAKGERKKAITNDDVRDQMVAMFPDEVADQEEKVAKLKGAVSHMERLADLWKTRCYSASGILSNLRK